MRAFSICSGQGGRGLRALALGLLLGILTAVVGCSSTDGAKTEGQATAKNYVDELRETDLIEVKFSGNQTPPEDVQERIKDDGTINLPLVGSWPARGKTASQLQAEIQNLYVPKYFRRLTVTVRTENRVFFVDGDVKRPDRYVYTGEMTVLKAIAAAGGFTDFAARGRIQLSRGPSKFVIDGNRAKDNPDLDLPVIPGDSIFVPRRSPFGN